MLLPVEVGGGAWAWRWIGMAMWMIIGVEGSVYNISAIKAEVARHELVFVGGMPNSGTSFVRGLLASEGVGKGQDVCRRTTNS